VFKVFLVDEEDDVHDPAGFITTVPTWTVDETFSIGSGESFRILEIKTEIADELLDAGFNGVFVVEPA
jgi:hypothetical protein